MDNLLEIEARLWEYIDGSASAQETSLVEKMIAENTVWRAKYHELLSVRKLLDLTGLEEPSMRFTKNVMEEIARLHITTATKHYINNKIIWGIGIFFLTVIIAFLGYGLSQVDWHAADPSNSLTDKLSSIDYSKVFNNTFVNIFMMLNVLLGLTLLDRYLSNKRKQFQ
jgi:hypothetical protein